MKKFFLAVIFLSFLFASLALADEIKFKLVLSPNEMRRVDHDIYQDLQFKGKRLIVSKKVLLSSSDIDKIGIWISPMSGDAMATVHFNDKGKVKLFKVTKRYLKRQLAIVVEDKLFSAPVMRDLIESGQAQIVSLEFKTPKDVENFIKRLGFIPYLELHIRSEAEAKDSYRYAKYAMEKSNQSIAGYIAMQLYVYNPNCRSIQKLLKEYPTLRDVLPKN